MADTSLWPVVVGGLLTGLFALGGIGVGLVRTARRDAAQERRETRKRRADKFEELVAAVYEYDHWLKRIVSGSDEPKTMSPFAKVQSISAVYFPQFDGLIRELDFAAYAMWVHNTKMRTNRATQVTDGMDETYGAYYQKGQACSTLSRNSRTTSFNEGPPWKSSI
jgi:hypothetical protein